MNFSHSATLNLFCTFGKTVWIVIDGGYTKRPFLKRALKTGVTVVGCLRMDAALRDLPPRLKKGTRSWSRSTSLVWEEPAQSGQAGRQQVWNIWNNLAVYNLNLWIHTLVELWAWDKFQLTFRFLRGLCRFAMKTGFSSD